jgi:hypothetical protein
MFEKKKKKETKMEMERMTIKAYDWLAGCGWSSSRAGFCLRREEDGNALYKLNDECMYCNYRGTIKT